MKFMITSISGDTQSVVYVAVSVWMTIAFAVHDDGHKRLVMSSHKSGTIQPVDSEESSTDGRLVCIHHIMAKYVPLLANRIPIQLKGCRVASHKLEFIW